MNLDIECSVSEMTIFMGEQDLSEISSEDLFSSSCNYDPFYEPDFGELWDK
jgi:hypothetical protein